MAKGYIFDLDGTLLDTELVWVEVTEKLLSVHGAPISHEAAVELACGRSTIEVYQDIAAHLNVSEDAIPALYSEARKYFDEIKQSSDIRIHGSIELLKRLSKTAPVCIASGSPRATIAAGLEYMGIEDCVSFYVGCEDYPVGKPDPSAFLLAAEKLGLPPEDCVVFEDSCPGVTAAKRAGMRCVAIVLPNHPKHDVSLADVVLDDLSKYTDESL
ncbi:MAG: HAD family phosphatase [Kiritimatiellae bacterium]|nr:HAD family phosphatase [Kiritimatiellia bacterium]